jgi:hypothetical protein
MEECTAAEEHIPEGTMLDYLDNGVDASTSARVRAHLSTGCERCTRGLSEWRRLLTALIDSGTAEPPPGVIERALGIMDRRRDTRLALMLFPGEQPASRSHLLPADAASMRLLFRAAGTDIDLLCEYEEGDWHIMGQALDADAPSAGWRVAAMGTSGLRATGTDRQGEFRLSSLAPGRYLIALRAADRRIVLPSVQLEGVRP